ncbi:hypothetical protein Mal52_32890 [Symmachiella dynata]|uniref:Uncharacterized protein n=1 Tax=Symmachiella dynata TaxID=2527995 RepID=A0A517ZQU4_9PLAN|nr:hypothetical protein Mal52_32890 [Symmachiella dynata]
MRSFIVMLVFWVQFAIDCGHDIANCNITRMSMHPVNCDRCENVLKSISVAMQLPALD